MSTFPTVRGDIAIIGIACTYPGARNAGQFWQNIVGKVDAITDVSPERWDPEVFYDPDPAKEDRIYCKKGGWMPDAFAFNPLAYGIMPSTVAGAEPDHFLVLRTVYEALEDAGYLENDARQRVSIILGKGNYLGPGVTALMYRGIVTEQALAVIKGLHPEFTPEHLAEIKQVLRSRLPAFGAETAAGLIPNISTGRVANRLDFMGRNFTIDAACASSLIATEIAIQDLLTDRYDLMLAGGIHIFAHIPFLQVFDAMRALSLSSTIRPYDEHCDGTISGEGVGILVLKRLADAERDRDRIYAVIKGAGSSSDGRAKGVTAPRVEGEELAMRRAYEMSGISPASVELIEGHGTGTAAGDAAEVQALINVLGPSRQGRPACALGSVKSMIGHAMPAAGAAGMIKAALSLYHRVLPPTLHCEKPRAEVTAPDSPIYINTDTRPWIRAGGSTPRRAGVSAFGFGGVNAHVILEEYAPQNEAAEPSFLRDWENELFVLTAPDRQTLLASIDALRKYTAEAQRVPLRDIAYSVSTNGATGEKLAIVASSHTDLVDKLGRAKDRLADPQRTHLRDRQGIYFFGSEPSGKVAILFPGEGSQYLNMLSELCVQMPQVRKAFDVADGVTRDPERWPLSAIVFPPPFHSEEQAKAAEARLFTIDRATEAVLTADRAIFELLQELGVKPNMMAGHSAGEWVAMAASGVLNRDQFVASMNSLGAMYRNIEEDSTVPRSTMLAVGAGRAVVEGIVAEIGGELHVANDNCPNQVVVVVSPQQEQAFVDRAQQRGILVEKLPYDRGYHTPAFTYICKPLRDYFAALDIRQPQVPLYSCTTASLYPSEPEQILDLVSNTFAQPLLFRQTIETMYEAGARIFIEAGPRGNLTAFVDDILRGRPHLAVPVDQMRRPGLTSLLHAIGMLAAANVPLDLRLLYDRRTPRALTFDVHLDEPVDETRAPGTMMISTCYPKLQPPPPVERVAHETVAPVVKVAAAAVTAGEMTSGGLGSFSSFSTEEVLPAVHNGHSAPLSATSSSMLDDHFALMDQFLETHEAVMCTFLGTGAATPALRTAPVSAPISEARHMVAPLPVVTPAEPPVAQPSALAPAPAPPPAKRDSIGTVFLKIVSERTGYPVDMLGLDLDMEADLGIDSIKRVEILGAMRQYGESAGTTSDVDMEQVAKLKTLRQVLESLEGSSSATSAPQPTASNECRGLTASGVLVNHVPGQSLTLNCDLSTAEHLYLNDHCLYFEGSDFGDQGSPVLSMPLTGSLEMMAEAASILCPELRVIGAKRMQAVKWVNVEKDGPPTQLVITANRAGDHVRVTVRRASGSNGNERNTDLFAEAMIVFGERYADAPAIHRPDLKGSRTPACTGRDIYSTHRMFHGPSFQCIEALETMADDGLIGRLRVLPSDHLLKSDPAPKFHINPFLLDAAGQLVGYWPVENLSEGFVALPIRIEEIILYQDNLPAGTPVTCLVHVREVTHRQLKADFDVIGPDGKLWMRVSGWEDWRFYWDRHIYEFWRFPNQGPNGRRIEIPGLADSDIEVLRIDALGEMDKTGLWENLWMHMVLNRRELRQYESMPNPEARTEWMFQQAGAKDAVRMWLQRHHSHMVYPADIEVVDEGTGTLRANSRANLPLPRSISVAYKDLVCVAAAGSQSVAVVIGEAGSDEWAGRAACAQNAAARLLGADDVDAFAVTEIDRARQRIIVTHGNGAVSASVTIDTARDGEWIVAVAHT